MQPSTTVKMLLHAHLVCASPTAYLYAIPAITPVKICTTWVHRHPSKGKGKACVHCIKDRTLH